MAGRRLAIKTELNYRRGSTAFYCSICDHFVRDHPISGIGGVTLPPAPRCRIIGLHNSNRYAVNPDNICDRFDNTLKLKRLGR